MTRAEEILSAGLEDAVAHFALLEATLRQFKDAPTAEVVRQCKNRASAALDRGTQAIQPKKDPSE